MKNLKFMFATAAAIGLASATQAAQYESSTGFEKWANLDQVVTTGYTDTGAPEDGSHPSYWQYAGSTAADNDSRVIALDMSGYAGSRPAGYVNFDGQDTVSRTNVLQVSTGTDPLLRKIVTTSGGVPLDGENKVSGLYVDVLVQFTVTPSNDVVAVSETAGVPDDKLMIYLKESVDGEGNVSTNLMVAAAIMQANTEELDPYYEFFPTNVAVGNVELGQVVPGEWYRLTVSASLAKAITSAGAEVESSYTLFKIKLNGYTLTSAIALDAAGGLDGFPSLQGVAGSKPTSLEYVGFAGEGKVDDLVITTYNPDLSFFDFTLLTDNAGAFTAVAFTVDGVAYSTESTNTVIKAIDGAPVVVTAIEYASGYGAADPLATASAGLTSVDGSYTNYTVTANATLTLNSVAAPTGIDFTFTCGSNVSAVNWTVTPDGGSPAAYVSESGKPVTAEGVAATDTIAITKVVYADWYAASGDYTNGWSGTGYTTDQNLTVAAASIDTGDAISIPDGTTAADLNVTNSAFAAYDNTELTKLMTWAKKTANTTIESINESMAFDGAGNPTTDLAEAYLLNCSEANLDDAKEDFAFTAFPPSADQFSDKGYNGTVEIEGTTSLTTPVWSSETDGPFYRATLKLQ